MMWDFHSHILPGIDDGAQDIEDTLAMAMIALGEGIDTIIATPHYIPYAQEIEREDLLMQVEKVNEILQEERIPLHILPGMEVFADWEILQRIDQGKIVTLQDTRYILIELPMQEIPEYIEDLLFEIAVRGLVVIIAHPERNARIQKNPNILKQWIEKGVLTQLNTGSLTGTLGQAAQEAAETLLQHDMVHILGTDAHTTGNRGPRMKEAVKRVQELVEESQAQMILEEYPSKIIKDETFTPAPPKEVKVKKKRFFFF